MTEQARERAIEAVVGYLASGEFEFNSVYRRDAERILALVEREWGEAPLLDVIKRELVQRGYEEVEPGGGGVWTHPEWGTTDHIFPAIQDCFEREA